LYGQRRSQSSNFGVADKPGARSREARFRVLIRRHVSASLSFVRTLADCIHKSGALACKGSTLPWSSGDALLGSGMVVKMQVPELSDSTFMVPSN
jgi:hypothetical protein